MLEYSNVCRIFFIIGPRILCTSIEGLSRTNLHSLRIIRSLYLHLHPRMQLQIRDL